MHILLDTYIKFVVYAKTVSTKMTSLCRIDFPIYACDVLDEKHVVVAGGGGASKTGVPNAVEILELEKLGKKTEANPRERMSTGDIAAMNMSVFSWGQGTSSSNHPILAIGLAGQCHLYSITKTSPNDKSDANNSSLKQRRTNKVQNEKKEVASQTDKFTFTLLKKVDTDASKDDPLQKTVRISRDGNLLVTGGCDGHVTLWKFPSFEKCFSSHGHKGDVVDVDISPDSKEVVSVSRDGTATTWDSASGDKTSDLQSLWNSHMTTRKYRFRCCRYGVVIDKPKLYVLFTAHTPMRIGKNNKDSCCLTKWCRKRKEGEDTPSGPLRPALLQHTGNEQISTLTLSRDGVFVGVGFMEGSVAIYIAFSLQCAKRVRNLHGIFVTSMTFVENTPSSQAITGKCDAALVSASVDNMCKLTKLSSRTTFPVWVAVVVSFVALVLTALYLQSLGVI